MVLGNGGEVLWEASLNSEGGREAIGIIPDEVEIVCSFLSVMDSEVFK